MFLLNKLYSYFGLFIFTASFILAQPTNNYSIVSSFPIDLIQYEFENVGDEDFKLFTGVRPFLLKETPAFNISYNHAYAINNGHSNIDNNGEFYALDGYNKITSVQLNYNNKWLSLFIEPYVIKQSTNPIISPETENIYKHLNNHYAPNMNDRVQSGFRQSGVFLHYRGFGLGYSKMSQWWGPGVHSSIALSSNAPGVGTYSIGTFKDLKYNNIAVGIKATVSPYNNYYDETPMYFSGLDAHITNHNIRFF